MSDKGKLKENAILNRKLERIARRKSSEEIDPEYPFISCIKKMAYAFGDLKDGNVESYKLLHGFAKNW